MVVHRRGCHRLESDHDDSLDTYLIKCFNISIIYDWSFHTNLCFMVIADIFKRFPCTNFLMRNFVGAYIYAFVHEVPPWSGVKEEFLLRHRRKNHSSCSKAQNLDNQCCFMSGTNFH